QEWTRFRGPNGSGIGKVNVPAPLTEKDIVWSIELPGSGHGSPVLWGQKIFLAGGEKETAKRMLLCINAADGRVIWRRDFESRAYRYHPENSYASVTPAVDAENVYINWITPESYMLFAYDHAGKELWKQDLG